jgi:hypothetical protein
MIDFETGSHERILDALNTRIPWANPDSVDFARYPNPWGLSISPDQTHAAIVFNENSDSSMQSWRYLFITELSSGVTHRVDGFAVGSPVWSTDGSMLAYFYPAQNRSAGIRVVNTEGTTMSQASLPRGLSTAWNIRLWNNCEPKPLL